MIPYETPHSSFRFQAWNHMNGIARNCVDHMAPCMELHGSLVSLSPEGSEKKLTFIEVRNGNHFE